VKAARRVREAVRGNGPVEPGHAVRQWRDLVPLMQSGAIDPPIGSVFALDRTAAAIREIDQRRAAGRVLVRVRGTTPSR
jgi:NADPH:quinone reductase